MRLANLKVKKTTFFNMETRTMEEKNLVIISGAKPEDFVTDYLYYCLQYHEIPSDATIIFE